MFESCYLIDPGSHTLRLFDPKTRTIVSLPACRLARGSAVGEDALRQTWSETERIVWPLFQEKIKSDPAPLLSALALKAPPDRFLLVPNARVLSFQVPEDRTLSEWRKLLQPWHLGQVDMVPAFVPADERPFVHIHAGHSLVHFLMGNHGEVVAYKALPIAGFSIDQAIADELARVFRVLIPMEDACALKEAVSKAFASGRNPTLEVTGLSRRGTYERLSFRATDLWGCMERVLLKIAEEAAGFVCTRGADLMEDALARPVRLSGGLAGCYGLAPLLERSLHTEVRPVEHPDTWLLQTLAAQRPSRLSSADSARFDDAEEASSSHRSLRERRRERKAKAREERQKKKES